MSDDSMFPEVFGNNGESEDQGKSDDAGQEGEAGAITPKDPEVSELDRIGPPESFDELQRQVEPFDAELTLLPSEPATPNCISREEHAQYLLGYARRELNDREWYTDFMFNLWAEVKKTLQLELNKHVPMDDGRSYEWLFARGIEEPEDLLYIDTAKELYDEVFESFVAREPLFQYNKMPRLDRAIAEELYRINLLAIEYLEHLPTEPEPNKEAFERVETHLTGRKGAAQRNRARGKKIDKLVNDVPVYQNNVTKRLDNTVKGEYNLVLHPEVENTATKENIDFLLDRHRELPEQQFYQHFLPGFFGSVLQGLHYDLFAYYVVAKDTERLNRIGYEGPEDVLKREMVVDDLRDAKELWEENEMPVGPFTNVQNILATSAHKGYGLIDEETYKEVR